MSRFLFNDASLHGQFASLAQLLSAFDLIFRMRDAAQQRGFRLEVNRIVAERAAVGAQTLRRAMDGHHNPEHKRRLLSWLDKNGPFWDEPPVHSAGEYFECERELVTESALAEACNLIAISVSATVVSLVPSRFSMNPLEVIWRGRTDGDQAWQIANHVSEPSLIEHLRRIERPIASWSQLLTWIRTNCPSLLLSPDFFSQLPTTFSPNVAQRAQILFKALDEINATIQKGERARFEQLRRLWMEGEKARMTDSSDSEKSDFAAEMNFKHPQTNQFVACNWHAKIKTPQFRIHFDWPKSNAQEPLFIGYFGPKLTRR